MCVRACKTGEAEGQRCGARESTYLFKLSLQS